MHVPCPCLRLFSALFQQGTCDHTAASSDQCSRLSSPKSGRTGQKPDPAAQGLLGFGQVTQCPRASVS